MNSCAATKAFFLGLLTLCVPAPAARATEVYAQFHGSVVRATKTWEYKCDTEIQLAAVESEVAIPKQAGSVVSLLIPQNSQGQCPAAGTQIAGVLSYRPAHYHGVSEQYAPAKIDVVTWR